MTPEEKYAKKTKLSHIQRAEKIKQAHENIAYQRDMILYWMKNCKYLKEE
jgi:hypothetical protein